MAAVTMTVGNLVAIAQHNIKRLLAYSSVGQVGFLLVGVAALPDLDAPGPVSALASNGIMLHLVGYATTNMVVFVGIIAFFNLTGKEEIADFAGLADRHPFLAASIAVGLFSLAGLPFFAGFTTKFYLFTAAANEGLLWLASLAILNSLISLYYYLVVIRHMYIQAAPSPSPAGDGDASPEAATAVSTVARLSPTPLILGVLALLVLGTFFIGVYPFPIVEALNAATASILPVG